MFDLAVRRRWVTANPCKLVDAPAVPPNSEVRFLTQEELVAVIDRGVKESKWAVVDRPLYLAAAIVGSSSAASDAKRATASGSLRDTGRAASVHYWHPHLVGR